MFLNLSWPGRLGLEKSFVCPFLCLSVQRLVLCLGLDHLPIFFFAPQGCESSSFSFIWYWLTDLTALKGRCLSCFNLLLCYVIYEKPQSSNRHHVLLSYSSLSSGEPHISTGYNLVSQHCCLFVSLPRELIPTELTNFLKSEQSAVAAVVNDCLILSPNR